MWKRWLLLPRSSASSLLYGGHHSTSHLPISVFELFSQLILDFFKSVASLIWFARQCLGQKNRQTFLDYSCKISLPPTMLSLESYTALPSRASRHVLIMYKVFEGGGEVVFRAFPVGIPITHPPHTHSPNSTTATPSFLCCHVSDGCVCPCNTDWLLVWLTFLPFPSLCVCICLVPIHKRRPDTGLTPPHPRPDFIPPHESFSGQRFGWSFDESRDSGSPKAHRLPSPLNPILWWVLSHLPLSWTHSAVNSSPSGSSEREGETGATRAKKIGDVGEGLQTWPTDQELLLA